MRNRVLCFLCLTLLSHWALASSPLVQVGRFSTVKAVATPRSKTR